MMTTSPIFKYSAHVHGAYVGAFHFESKEQQAKWLLEDFPKLKKRYGNLQLSFRQLDGLKVGDECQVVGEGIDVFKIKGVVQWSDHRWGFVLGGHGTEEVHKCYKVTK